MREAVVVASSRTALAKSFRGSFNLTGPEDLAAHCIKDFLEKMSGLYMVMGNTAEVVAKRYRVSRESQDEYSLLSQQRTTRAQQEAFFDAEIAPMRVTRGVLDKRSGELVGKEEATVNRDECNRPDTTLQGLLNLKPHFDPGSGQGSVTAGNSSQLSDGASATLLMSRQRADQLDIPYKLVFRGFQVAGCEPDEMGIGPVFAVPKLLNRCGLRLNDIDIWELNQAFAFSSVMRRLRSLSRTTTSCLLSERRRHVISASIGLDAKSFLTASAPVPVSARKTPSGS